MKKIATEIDGLFVIEPQVFGDERGFFLESYSKEKFADLEILEEFVQDNHSKSKRGVLRGLHFQTQNSQGKLVRVVAGAVFDVAVDLRKGSPTFGKSFGLEISAKNKLQLYIPQGFAHGFLTLEDDTEFLYKCTDYYAPQFDSGILWNDKDLAVDWKLADNKLNENELIISEKDKKQQSFNDFCKNNEKF